MQPYQKAEEALRKSGEGPINFAKNTATNVGLAAIGGTGLAVGSSVSKAILPRIKSLINEYVPVNFALKGLEKIDPRFKTFIQGGKDAGFDDQEILNVVGEKVGEAEKINESRNIIEQYSPELFSFLDQEVRKGTPLAKASSEAQKKYKDVIKRMEKDHKIPFVDILEKIFGEETGRQMALKKFNQKKKGLVEQEIERYEQGYGRQVQPPEQGQGLDAQVAQIVANGNAVMDLFKGKL